MFTLRRAKHCFGTVGNDYDSDGTGLLVERAGRLYRRASTGEVSRDDTDAQASDGHGESWDGDGLESIGRLRKTFGAGQ